MSPETIARIQGKQAGGGSPSLFEQFTNVVTGLPSGLGHMAQDAAWDVAGLARLPYDLAAGNKPPSDWTVGDVFADYFPLSTSIVRSVGDTGERVGELGVSLAPGGLKPSETEYGRAVKEGRIVPMLLEDAGNAAIVASAATKALTLGAKVAPKLAPAAELAQKVTRGTTEAANVPARVYTVPLKAAKKAVTGGELPRIFGETAEGLPRRMPGLIDTKPAQRLLESDAAKAATEALHGYQERRGQRREVREGFLQPQSALYHLSHVQLERMFRPAEHLMRETDMQHATLLSKAGVAPVLERVVRLADELPPEKFEALTTQVFGREMKPSPKTIETVLAYADETLDPAIRQQMDEAWDLVDRPIRQVEEVKLSGEGREKGPLSEEQLGDEPMPSRVDFRLGRLRQRAEDLRTDIEGTPDRRGVRSGGLRDELAQAKSLVPPVPDAMGAEAVQRLLRRGVTKPLEREVPRLLASEERLAGRQAAGDQARQQIVESQRQGKLEPAAGGWRAPEPPTPKDAAALVRHVREQVSERVRTDRQAVRERLASQGEIRVPRPGDPMRDLFDQIQDAMAEGSSSQKRRFRNPAISDAGKSVRSRGLFGRAAEASGLDELTEAYVSNGWATPDNVEQVIVDDVRQLRAQTAELDAVRNQGYGGDPTGYTGDPIEAAALRGSVPEAVRAVQEAHWEAVLPENDTPAWRMSQDDYVAEVRSHVEALRQVDDVHPNDWPPEAFAAEQRLEQLIPRSVQGEVPVSPAVLHDRILELARRGGREGVVEPVFAGGQAVERAQQRAGEAFDADAFTKEMAAEAGQPVNPESIARRGLTPQERRLYDEQAAAKALETATTKIEGKREQLVGGVREGGEQAGLRFGERRGKRQRDVQNVERELRKKAHRLAWLEDERIPAEAARLAEGPREVAPGKYVPALAHGERLRTAVDQMANDLVEQTGDATAGVRLQEMVADVPVTMKALQDRGVLPEYVPGAVDEPTRGGLIAGSQEQLPFIGTTPSERRKTQGHVPKQFRTVQRQLAREMHDVARNGTAAALRDRFAKQGADLLDELVNQGEIPSELRDSFMTGRYDKTIDLAAEMKRRGFTAWDPESPTGRMSDGQVRPDSYFLPTPIAEQFVRWWKAPSENILVRGYDYVTRGFKHNVLAMSPQWHMYNVLGNTFMSTFGAGESPVTIAKYARQARKLIKEMDRDSELGHAALPPRLFAAGPAAEVTRMMSERMVEPRTRFGRAIRRSYDLNQAVDNIGRSAVFLAKKARGYGTEDAVRLALQAMGDFSNLSPFERNVVRRVLPFYSWMRHITQATARLSVEHPWRVAWMLHMSDMFDNSEATEGLPDWLRSSVNLGGGWFLPIGAMNPYQTSVGSAYTSPKDWPKEFFRSLNPIIKFGGQSVGINLGQGRLVSRPPGSGPRDEYGRPLWSFQAPSELAYMAARTVPVGRLFTDLTQKPVVRYDTGDEVRTKTGTIPLEGGRPPLIVRDFGVPFPVKVDAEQTKARMIKADKANATARRRYEQRR